MWKWLGQIFGGSSGQDEELAALWRAAERMEPRLSYQRLKEMRLPADQHDRVSRLLVGDLPPAHNEDLRRQCLDQQLDENGVDALLLALQSAMDSDELTWVLNLPDRSPVAVIPRFRDAQETTVIILRHEETAIVTMSLEEVLQQKGIHNHSLVSMTPAEFYRKAQGGDRTPSAMNPSGSTISVTLEKPADDQERLLEPFAIDELLDAIQTELGMPVPAEAIELESPEPIETLGLYRARLQVAADHWEPVHFWLVPTAKPTATDE